MLDHLGTPTTLMNNNDITTQRTFNEFGISNDIQDNEIGYTGYLYDEVSQLNYAQARFYNPEDARFSGLDNIVNFDETPIGFNRYNYVGNDPMNYVDMDGNIKSSIKDIQCGPYDNGKNYSEHFNDQIAYFYSPGSDIAKETYKYRTDIYNKYKYGKITIPGTVNNRGKVIPPTTSKYLNANTQYMKPGKISKYVGKLGAPLTAVSFGLTYENDIKSGKTSGQALSHSGGGVLAGVGGSTLGAFLAGNLLSLSGGPYIIVVLITATAVGKLYDAMYENVGWFRDIIDSIGAGIDYIIQGQKELTMNEKYGPAFSSDNNGCSK